MPATIPPDLDDQLVSPAFYQDPYPVFDRLRAEAPVAWSEALGAWVLTRYEHVQATLFDPRRFSSHGRLSAALERFPPELHARFKPLEDHFGIGLIGSDPPNHTRLRALINKAFVPRIIDQMRSRLQALIDELIDAVLPRGQMDLVRDLAYPLPATVITELLGAPVSQRENFKRWSDGILAFQGSGVVSAELIEHSQGHLLEMRAYLSELIAERRGHPRDDLLSRLVEAEAEGDRLTAAELLVICVTLLTAGHETTTNLIANGVYTLLRHPEQMEALRRDPQLMPGAIEEVLRFEGPLQRNPRRAAEDFEFGGQLLRRNDYLLPLLGAANRDPLAFPEPQRFDIARQPNRHLAFGQGIHFCVGAPLARLEGQLALNTILRRLPGLRLNAATVEWEPHTLFRALRALPVAFGRGVQLNAPTEND
jgi:pimeloyl-[acyl-carrier protein] synthase